MHTTGHIPEPDWSRVNIWSSPPHHNRGFGVVVDVSSTKLEWKILLPVAGCLNHALDWIGFSMVLDHWSLHRHLQLASQMMALNLDLLDWNDT